MVTSGRLFICNDHMECSRTPLKCTYTYMQIKDNMIVVMALLYSCTVTCTIVLSCQGEPDTPAPPGSSPGPYYLD